MNYNKNKESIIICNNGDCFIESKTDILGIEIDFTGTASITPTLPDGWIMQGSKSKMLLIGLQGLPIKNQKLFTYEGSITIKKVIVANNEAKRILCAIQNVNLTWDNQYWTPTKQQDTWDNFKSKVKKVRRQQLSITFLIMDYQKQNQQKKQKLKQDVEQQHIQVVKVQADQEDINE